MTSTLEYSYISDGFSIRVNESLINRAVRVKSIVRDKLKRVYNNNVVLETTEVEQPNIGVENVEGDTLFDLSEERLNDLNDKLNALQIQSSVPCVSNRAVLFTKALVSKIEGVSKKWFKNMPDIKKEDATVEMPTVEENSVVSGIIPGTWDDVENVNKEETQNEAPAIETEVSEPEVEVPEPQVEISMPNLETEPSDEVKENYEVPSFMPSMDEFVPSEEAAYDSENEYVPEPQLVAGDSNSVVESSSNSENYETTQVEVEEPTSIPLEAVEKESQGLDSSEQVESEEPEHKLTIEEKIAQLIERKTQNHSEEDVEVRVVSEQAPSEEEDKKLETKPELTQAGVIARLQRLNNTMKDKDATIRKLTANNEATREELAQAREKIGGYEAVVNDLTVKNNSLTKENERLSQKVEEAETASQSTITKLEAQVAELTESKAEEIENSKKIIADLREKHAKEISELKERHAAELKSVSDTKERQIQAIYATISEALGESTEEDYGRSMAA